MELIDIIKDLRKNGLTNGSALGKHAGIYDEAADLLEKSFQKKPVYVVNKQDCIKCPVCDYELGVIGTDGCIVYHNYCPNCGQALDWKSVKMSRGKMASLLCEKATAEHKAFVDKLRTMYSALDIARYVIHYCEKKNYIINNLKLQDVLYFIQAEFLRVKKFPCFFENMEAWDIGTVVPEVYHEYQEYGVSNISISDKDCFDVKNEDIKLIDSIVDKCLKLSV